MGGFFPVVEATDWVGQCDRTGHNSFKCNQIAYGIDANHKVIVIYMAYETRERMPDGTLQGTLDSCAFGFWQDPFGDEFPVYGCNYNIPVYPQEQMTVRDTPVR